MPSQPILRFAPSPNGYLHLGHAFSALLNAKAAAALGGKCLLRIEDIDLGRCRPEYVAALQEDLRWLGLDWPEPVLRQSERFSAYAEAANRLKAQGFLYTCFCTRGAVAARATGRDPDGAPLYPGTCRGLSEAEIASRLARGEIAQYRLKMDVAWASLSHEKLRISHEFLFKSFGERAIAPERWGDVVLVRKDTPTSYHLSVVVDDAAQGITHIIRGQDLEAATDVHVVLQKLLGLPTPLYFHHALIVDEAEQKLAKSKGAPSLRSLREAGWTPADVRRRLGLD